MVRFVLILETIVCKNLIFWISFNFQLLINEIFSVAKILVNKNDTRIFKNRMLFISVNISISLLLSIYL